MPPNAISHHCNEAFSAEEACLQQAGNLTTIATSMRFKIASDAQKTRMVLKFRDTLVIDACALIIYACAIIIDACALIINTCVLIIYVYALIIYACVLIIAT